MNPIDLTISIIILIGIIRGFMKGFIYEIAVLGALFVSYFLGFKLADSASIYIAKIIHINETTLHYVSLLAVWISISIGIIFLAKLFEGLVNIAALGIFNKIAGALFGGMKYALLLSVFIFFLNRWDISTTWLNADKKADSYFYYPLLHLATGVFAQLNN
jgi:membrane protein required for colicin V production